MGVLFQRLTVSIGSAYWSMYANNAPLLNENPDNHSKRIEKGFKRK